MRRLGPLTALLLLVPLASCAVQGERIATSLPHHCDGRTGRVVGRLDVDDDGKAEPVRLPRSGACAPFLLAWAHGSVAWLRVSGMGIDPTAVQVVHLRSGEDVLLLRHFEPRRHGYQPWLVAGGHRELALLGSREDPVLPFVHTDGGHAPVTATCTEDGFAVWTATAHTPPGIVASWDVHRTTYTLEGGRLVPGGGSVVARDVPDPTLRRERPQMYDPEGLFSDC